MISGSKKIYLRKGIALVFIFLFVYTAAGKLLDMDSFRFALGQSPLIGSKAEWISITLPLTELAMVLLLLFSRTQVIGMCGSLLLMLLFTAYISYMLLVMPHLPCSCGGVLRQLTWKQHLVLNVMLTALAGWGYVLAKQKQVPPADTDLPVAASTG